MASDKAEDRAMPFDPTTSEQMPVSVEPAVDEDEHTRLKRLGWQRPEKLGSAWREVAFVFSIAMSQIMTEYFLSGYSVLVPTVVKALDIPPTAVTWPMSAMSLVIACCLIPFGRLADMFGGYPVYVAGCAWYCIWSLIAGFAQNAIMFDVCRAMQGLGAAAYLPAGLMLLGSIYRPGPRKNVVFSIYGAAAPFGFFVGIFFAGLSAQFTIWEWAFYVGAILTFVMLITAVFAIPNDYAERRGNNVKMDWLCTSTLVSGLVLFVFAITDASSAPNGWATSYILATLIIGIALLGVTFYIEGWVAEQPLLPFEVFKIKYIRPFIMGLFFCYGTIGVYILYATLYAQDIMGAQPFQLVAWYAPLGVGGTFIAIFGGFLFHIVPAKWLMFITGAATLADSLLFAVMPEGGGYWAFVFPASICATIAIDLIFSVANIFFSNNLPGAQQGLGGALSNVLLQLGIAVELGFADVVASQTAHQGLRRSYKNVFWFEFACGATALVLFMFFVKIKKAESDYTVDEKREADTRERERERERGGAGSAG